MTVSRCVNSSTMSGSELLITELPLSPGLGHMPAPGVDEAYIMRVRDLAPPSALMPRFPSVRQCVGTNRLWGPSLGWALADDLNAGEKTRRYLIDIAVLSRAVLVLADYLDDELLEDAHRNGLCDWIGNIERELEKAYSSAGEDFDYHHSLRGRSKAATMHWNVDQSRKNAYESSIAKCLIFFNPYRLALAQNHRLHKSRLYFLEMFFFACQILDDFQDLSEDLSKRLNHNLFLTGHSQDIQERIVATRLKWLAPLLGAVRYNLTREAVFTGTGGSLVLRHFHAAAIAFLDEMLRLIGAHSTNIAFPSFEEWDFDPLALAVDTAPRQLEPFIRPEFLQTYASGLRRIQEV